MSSTPETALASSTLVANAETTRSDKSLVSPSTTTTTTPYSFGFIVGVAAAAFFVLMLLIFAICKYRNRDEGTYRIDETKNFGPFAELDAPLNGAGSSKSRAKSSASGKNRRKGVGVKEWYV